MICPTCGAEVASTKFCVNCGSSLPAAFEWGTQPIAQETQSIAQETQSIVQGTQPVIQETQPVAQQTPPIEQSTAPMGSSYTAEVPGDSAWQAQPQQAYQTGQTLQMPPQPQQGAGGGYVPPTGGPQPPNQQSVPYQAPPSASAGNQAPNAAFVLVIVGLVLSVLFVTFLPGIICSIIGLVLNAGYNKRGLNNPRKTSTKVIGIIGIVIGVMCVLFTIFIGVVAAQVIDEAEKQGIDIVDDSVEVTTGSSGNIAITVGGSSSGAASGASNASSAASASSGSSAVSDPSIISSTSLAIYEDGKYHDVEWNPSLYSIIELNGAELSEMLEYYNYYWDDDYKGWMAADGSMFAADDASGELTQSQIAALPKGAAGQAVVMGLWAEGYATPSDALTGLSKDIVVEKKANVNEALFAIVSGPSNVRYLLFVTPSSAAENEQAILLFTEESISSGLFTSLTGVDAGSSIDGIWSTVLNGGIAAG